LRIQLHGANPEEIFQAASLVLEHLRPDGLDLNAGCPAPKVVRTGAGAALLKDLPRLYEEASALKEACQRHGVEASVKFRLGFHEDRLEEIAEVLLRAGIKILALHARLAKEGFSGKARWHRIRDLKRLVGHEALVIGNGDVRTRADIEQLFEETGCDGVMIGRAALSRPWIFREWREGRSLEPDLGERLSLLETLWHDLLRQRGKEGAAKALKVLVPKILKGLPGRKKITTEFLHTSDPERFFPVIRRMLL
jgi:tRNA-dihydrouridine synthase